MASVQRITFLLPGAGKTPSGGHKVVYEYANHLAARGYTVSIVHPAILQNHTPHERVVRFLRYIYYKTTNSFKPDLWFRIDPRVQLFWVPTLNEANIPDGDIVIATAWQTAEVVARYSTVKGKKVYLIQGLETWSGPEERVVSTWKLPMEIIVISKWLLDFGHNLGAAPHYIPNGLDFTAFGVDINPEDRDPNHVIMLYHTNPIKGSKQGLEALKIAKMQNPSLQASLFGTPSAPHDLPHWIKYYRCPEQEVLRQLYNRASIFISPSWMEGWGLPASEALMCGTALVATDIGGHREYAIHGQTALLAPPQNSEALAAHLINLTSDSATRVALARRGNELIQKFTWTRAIDSFEQVIHNMH